MARQPSGKDSVPSSAGAKDAEAVEEEFEELDDEVVADDVDDVDDTDVDLIEDDSPERSAATIALWASLRIEPVEISLRQGTGYTLRAYRMSDELAVTEADAEDDDFAAYERNRRPAVAPDDDKG